MCYNEQGQGLNNQQENEHNTNPGFQRVYVHYAENCVLKEWKYLQSWEKNITPLPPYNYVDVPIYEYLEELARRGENVNAYRTIWYYY